MFIRTIEKRARGHSTLEVKGLLIKAVKHPEGLKVLHNLPTDDMPLDNMLDKLEAIFGAPDVLAPLIIRKVFRVSFRGGRKGAFAPPWVLNAPPWILSAPHPFERTDIY